MESYMNTLGHEGIPFLFIIDFELEKPIVIPLNLVDEQNILYKVQDRKNYHLSIENSIKKPDIKVNPIDFDTYSKAHEYVVSQQNAGNSYLTNLTFPSKIEMNMSLTEIFLRSQAKYKLLLKDQFVVFSPETFVRIENGVIFSYPMKGTIDAQQPNARQTILNDQKEAAEHATIVDLIRNDLSRFAKNVTVKRYRYLDEIITHQKRLFQVSSEIAGKLPDDYCRNLGSIIYSLLPAGSVSGAPKQKTLEIIRKAENSIRGYYSGIFGLFDGQNLDSAVMIRYIERQNGSFYYRSGGGITAKSKLELEYQELIDKIYLPFM